MGVSVRTILSIMGAATLLAACQTTKPPPAPPLPVAEAPRDDTARRLVGAWALTAIECESDNGLVYKADGSWFSYGALGTWSVSGDQLIKLITHRGEGLGDEKPVVPPAREVTTIVALTATRLETRWSDGERRTLVRCPGTPG